MPTEVTEVFVYEAAGVWLVTVDGETADFESRQTAHRAARDRARRDSPSRLITQAPPDAQPAPAADAPAPVSPPPARAPVDPPDPVPAGDIDWALLAGPGPLGRSLLLGLDTAVPAPWSGCPEQQVDRHLLTDEHFLGEVRHAYLERIATVYRCAPDVTEPPDTALDGAVWRHQPDLALGAEDAWYFVTANSVDGRDPQRPFWPLATGLPSPRVAGAEVLTGDGTAAFIDGGPFRHWTPDDTGGATVVPRVALDRGHVEPLDDTASTAELAADQLAAVMEPTGTSRIIAPAGSGKTRVLTERTRHLLGSGVPAESLCLVAFNKRAQIEMTERTTDLRGLQIRTLNALGLAIINGSAPFEPQTSRVATIAEPDVRNLLSDLVRFPRRANTDPAAAWLDALSAVRLGLRAPTEVEEAFGGDVDGFADFFDNYRQTLRQRGVVDFDDQIYLAIELLLRDPAARRTARRSCQLMLVDEFQDLTPAHLLLVRLLAGPNLQVFGVGDDDQTIYGYSGASPRWLVDYDHYFPGARDHALEINYRCPAAVVTAATNLLSRNAERVDKTVRPAPEAVAGTEALSVARDEDPAVATVEHVRTLVAAGSPPKDIAVLARVNALLPPVQAGLAMAGIPAENREATRFLDRTGVAAVLSWLRIATQRGLRGTDVQRAARRPSRGLSPRVIEWMAEQGDLGGLRRLADRVQERDAKKVRGFADDVETITRLAAGADTEALVRFVRDDIGLDKALGTLDAAHRGRNSAAHTDDLRALLSLARLHDDPSTFGSWLDGVLAPAGDGPGVQLSTVHKVKGLEWPHVVVHDATDGIIPHRLSTDIEEERRIFHVAITRCRDSVTVTTEKGHESIFVAELDEPAPHPPLPVQELPSSEPSETETVPATVGLDIYWGGYQGEIAELRENEAMMRCGGALLSVPYGSNIKVERRPAVLGPPAKGKATRIEAAPGDAGLFEALKAWRLERSRADGVPAFVVANDRSLHAIAAERPNSLSDLSSIHGIGPAKLENYGDEILAVVDAHAEL